MPLDYEDESAGTIGEVAMVKHVASDPDARIGSLLVNPGGPGYGGSFLAEQAEFIYSEGLLASFDIIGFDPRTGNSTPPSTVSTSTTRTSVSTPLPTTTPRSRL